MNRVIVHLYGGVGNQLFQYAFGEYIRHKYLLDVCYDTSTFGRFGPPRDFQIEIINPNISIFKDGKFNFSRYQKFLRRGLRLLFKIVPGNKYYYDTLKEPLIINRPFRNLYFDGYWQDYKYVSWIMEHIGDIFRPKEPEFPVELREYVKLISSKNITSIHIRRGDYLRPENLKLLGICTLNYYRKAVAHVLRRDPNTEILVFTDDKDWVKDNLKLLVPFKIVNDSGVKPLWLIYLMGKCKNNILSNSTFSWWGNFLNNHPNKITVAPLHWMKQRENPNIYRPDWHIINNWE
ncbi:MAG: alpha-1,2-fucosyltransferase [Bacteroides sp.]|nr:alpha-1,2-fucosyltransferase [Bacteroides sp.]